MKAESMEDEIRLISGGMRRVHRYFREIARRSSFGHEQSQALDRLSGRQMHMVFSVRDLCELRPDGVSLKDLAREYGVTAPSASSMVDSLVKEGILIRETSVEDRRSIRIKLAPEMARHFTEGEEAVVAALHLLAERLGERTISQWYRIISRVEKAIDTGGVRQAPGN